MAPRLINTACPFWLVNQSSSGHQTVTHGEEIWPRNYKSIQNSILLFVSSSVLGGSYSVAGVLTLTVMENFDSTIDWRGVFRDEIESAGPWIQKDGHANQVFSTVHGGSVDGKSRVVFSPDGRRVAASATDRVIFVETSGWTKEKELFIHVTNLVVAPESDGYSFVCGSRGALIWISSKDLEITRQAALPHDDEVIGLLHDPDVVGRFYVLTPVDFCVFDGTTLVSCISILSDTPTLAFAQSRRWVVLGGRKGLVFAVRKSDLQMEFEVLHQRVSDILSVCCNDDVVFR